jgi:hypothetical protein
VTGGAGSITLPVRNADPPQATGHSNYFARLPCRMLGIFFFAGAIRMFRRLCPVAKDLGWPLVGLELPVSSGEARGIIVSAT